LTHCIPPDADFSQSYRIFERPILQIGNQREKSESVSHLGNNEVYCPIDGRGAFEDAVERMRAERQAVKSFTEYVERELASGNSLAEIGDMPARV
jgi:hypothetical protein